MTLGQALGILRMGREWRYEEEKEDIDGVEGDIIRLFRDDRESPLSLHSMFEIDPGKIGQWFAPSEAFRLLR